MAKGNNVLKYVGVVAIVYVLSKGVSKEIIRNINYSFTRLRLVNFWQNIKRLKVELEVGMTIENTNDVVIEVGSFDGYLTYKEEQLVRIIQNIAVILEPRVRQPLKFTMKTDLIGAAAKMYLAVTGDKKRIEGCRIKGDLRVKIEGIPLFFPYDEPVSIDL